MLEFCKTILQKVSFDRHLFQKELEKSLLWLKKHEAAHLKAWVLATFAGQFDDIIKQAFSTVS